MREIKFRGYNKKNKKWLFGSYILNRGHHFVAPDEFADDKTWEDYEVEEASIGQFAGLYDIKGQEIYEGDILQIMNDRDGFYTQTGVVRFIDNGFVYCMGAKPDGRGVYATFPLLEFVVIGNVFEKPKMVVPKVYPFKKS